MSSANVTRMKKVYEPQSAVGEESGHVRDLVFLRDVLASHGATPSELRQYDAVIDRRAETARRGREARRDPVPLGGVVPT